MGARHFIAGAAVGAAAAYFFDPDNGTLRRHIARDRGLAKGRHLVAGAERRARYAEGVAEGVVARRRPSPRDASALNDPALEAKVESEIFRSPEAPKGDVNVNVENHVVYLRGHLDDPVWERQLVESASKVKGVREVRSLIKVGG